MSPRPRPARGRETGRNSRSWRRLATDHACIRMPARWPNGVCPPANSALVSRCLDSTLDCVTTRYSRPWPHQRRCGRSATATALNHVAGLLPPGADKEIAVAPARHRAWLALAMPLVFSVFAPDAAATSEAQPAAVAGSELTRTSGALERLDDVDMRRSPTSGGALLTTEER